VTKESIFVQLDAQMENTALGKMLKKEHDWCDDRIAKLEAEVARLRADSERMQYCADNAIALDFDYGGTGECVAVIRLPPDRRYFASLRPTIDIARASPNSRLAPDEEVAR